MIKAELKKTMRGRTNLVCPMCGEFDNFSILVNVYRIKHNHLEIFCRKCHYGHLLSNEIVKAINCACCNKEFLINYNDYNYPRACDECSKLPIDTQIKKRIGLIK